VAGVEHEHGGLRERASERTLKLRARIVGWIAVAAVLALLGTARTAVAQERRIETAAKEALKHARADFSAADFDTGLARLLKAAKACGTVRCSTTTRAALLRDEGVMRLRRGEAGKAAALFAEAVRTDSKIDLPKAYDVPDVRAAWDAAIGSGQASASEASESQPTGDFTHIPVNEQAVNTPIPLYVEYSGSEHVASVVVKYQPPGSSEWKKTSLGQMGSGWGGTIPCAEVKLGKLHYYIQGFDASGSPNVLSGSPKKPFHTMVRPTITSTPPSLPGQSPPVACTGAQDESEVSAASTCIDDSQCNGGACQNGQCMQPTASAETERGYARLWIGFTASLDVVPLSSASDVCALTSNATPYNSAGYTCTNPNGSDFPTRASPNENGTLRPGTAGKVDGALAVGDVRLLLSADYAFTPNFLLGARIGTVVHTGAGPAAFSDGHGMRVPDHFELRGTYVFGRKALTHSGFAPLVFLGAGAAHFDAGQTVSVSQTSVEGPLQKNAWRVGGPGFLGIGVGVRYAFSQRVAFTAALKIMQAFGGSALLSVGPEVGLAYGF
jgi:hypothetical protein